MPTCSATTPPGTTPAAMIRMNSQLASRVAVPTAGTKRLASARTTGSFNPQPGQPRTVELDPRVQDDRHAGADAEEKQVPGRHVARVRPEDHPDQHQGGDRPDVLHRGRGGRELELPAGVLGRDGQGDDAVARD